MSICHTDETGNNLTNEGSDTKAKDRNTAFWWVQIKLMTTWFNSEATRALHGVRACVWWVNNRRVI